MQVDDPLACPCLRNNTNNSLSTHSLPIPSQKQERKNQQHKIRKLISTTKLMQLVLQNY